MPTKITPAALRTAAAKQRLGKPKRDGWSVCERTRHWDAVIFRRQFLAQTWRTHLAGSMEMDGVTELRASTFRLIERQSFRCRPITVTIYAYTDGSPYLYRIGPQFYGPVQFRKQFGEYYTLTRAGDIGPIFGTPPRPLAS
jgi:hypothetical protein